MRKHSRPDLQIKPAGGVRKLDDLLHLNLMFLGVTRLGTTATIAINEEAKRRAIGREKTLFEYKTMNEEGKKAGY